MGPGGHLLCQVATALGHGWLDQKWEPDTPTANPGLVSDQRRGLQWADSVTIGAPLSGGIPRRDPLRLWRGQEAAGSIEVLQTQTSWESRGTPRRFYHTCFHLDHTLEMTQLQWWRKIRGCPGLWRRRCDCRATPVRVFWIKRSLIWIWWWLLEPTLMIGFHSSTCTRTHARARTCTHAAFKTCWALNKGCSLVNSILLDPSLDFDNVLVTLGESWMMGMWQRSPLFCKFFRVFNYFKVKSLKKKKKKTWNANRSDRKRSSSQSCPKSGDF